MMESLEIRNFLTIRQAKVDVRPFTILIGPQASGKSVIAKLLFYFRDFLAKQYLLSILNQETKKQLETRAVGSFGQLFPSYTWSDQAFQIEYRSDDTTIFISRQGRSTKKPGIKVDYSQNLVELHRKAKSRYKQTLGESKGTGNHLARQLEFLGEALGGHILETSIGHHFHRSIFIPAGRSFFANLQKNVFSFLTIRIDIDPLIEELGSEYESSKTIFDRRIISEDQMCLGNYEEMKREFEKILAGQYVYEDGQDWIISDKRRINLAHASSGQQEALPLLVVLSAWFQYGSRGAPPATFFIEEPEAHLFPVSQRRLIGIFSRLYNAFKHNFFLTTHSPYILTALNNLIMASNLVQEKGQDVTERVQEIIGQDKMIRFEDVSAYTIQDGSLESILDPESRLIGSSIIDSVSDEFDQVFDRLMEVELSYAS